MTTKTLQIPTFNGDDYQGWAFNIKAVLLSKKLWNITSGAEERPADDDDEELQADFDDRSGVALGLIFLSLDRSLHTLVSQPPTTVRHCPLCAVDIGHCRRESSPDCSPPA
jgi:hypothetical protein